MKKFITCFCSFAVLILLFAGTAKGQLFQQDFSTALTAGNNGGGTIVSNSSVTDDAGYVNSNASASQFTYLATNNDAASIELSGDGVMRLTRAGSGTIYVVRNTNFEGPPAAAKVTFDFNAEMTASNSGGAIEFMLGSNFPNSNNNPGTSDRHSRFFVNTKSPNGTPGTWGVTPENASSVSAYATNETITWVINNSGSPINYSAPDGSTESVANDSYDLWVGNTKEYDDYVAVNGDTDINNFEIRSAGGNGIYTIDNLTIEAVTAGGSSSPTDYFRTKASGNWGDASTWESSADGSTWADASLAPTDEANAVTILNGHTVTVAASVTVDQVTIEEGGQVTVNGDPVVLTIADGADAVDMLVNGTLMVTGSSIASPGPYSVNLNSGAVLSFDSTGIYNHNQNGGAIPMAEWGAGSTVMITGVTGNSPANGNQDFYNFVWNNPGQSSNLNLGWSGNTIGGNLTVESSGGSRFQMSNNSAYEAPITIMGDVIVTGGTLASNGSSGPQTYTLNVMGNVDVTGGNFSLSRGSGGIANWYLFGDLSVSNATIQTSNNSSKIVFASADSQDVSMSSVTLTGSINYEVDTNAVVNILNGADSVDMVVNGTFTNNGSLNAEGYMQFTNGATYIHAINGGSVPVSQWDDGSTAMFTGITNEMPGNRAQDYYNLVWNNPNQQGNYNMGFDGNTIGGDITVISSGSARLYLTGPATGDTVDVTVMGDITLLEGAFSSNGTGNGNTVVTVNHYGNVYVSAGNFAVSRGSQGNGSGTTTWNLFGDTISIANATVQNSNPFGAKFVVAGNSVQNLMLENVSFGGGGLPLELASGSILDLGTSEVGGNGNFTINAGAALRTANVAGLDSTVKTTGTITISPEAVFVFNGTEAQVTGATLPSTVSGLAVANEAGVTLTNDVTVDDIVSVDGDLNLDGHTITLGSNALVFESAGNTIMGEGKVSVTTNVGTPSGNNVGGLGIALTADKDLGNTTIERYNTAITGQGNQGIKRYYHIEPGQNNSGLNATLRFYYDESELNGMPEATLALFKSPSGEDNSWAEVGGTVNAEENYIELSGISEFSYWGAATSGIVLPVELSAFEASFVDNKVVLNWSTATESQNRGWDIERMSENSAWTKIGFVIGSGDRTESVNYSFTDDKVVSGNIQYRLKQIDYNGTFEYSKIVEVVVNNIPTEYALLQNYPNPFNPSTTIKFQLPEASFVNISVYNAIGERVLTLVNEQMEAGYYTKNLDAGNLNSGIYFYTFTANNKVFTKKMLLLK